MRVDAHARADLPTGSGGISFGYDAETQETEGVLTTRGGQGRPRAEGPRGASVVSCMAPCPAQGGIHSMLPTFELTDIN